MLKIANENALEPIPRPSGPALTKPAIRLKHEKHEDKGAKEPLPEEHQEKKKGTQKEGPAWLNKPQQEYLEGGRKHAQGP